jgi:hypothetical protein
MPNLVQRQPNKMPTEYLAISHVIPCCIFWSSMTRSIKLPDVPLARPHWLGLEALNCLMYRRHVHTEGYWYCWRSTVKLVSSYDLFTHILGIWIPPTAWVFLLPCVGAKGPAQLRTWLLHDGRWRQRTHGGNTTKASTQTRVFPPPTYPQPPNRNAHIIMKWVEAQLHNEGQGPSLWVWI